MSLWYPPNDALVASDGALRGYVCPCCDFKTDQGHGPCLVCLDSLATPKETTLTNRDDLDIIAPAPMSKPWRPGDPTAPAWPPKPQPATTYREEAARLTAKDFVQPGPGGVGSSYGPPASPGGRHVPGGLHPDAWMVMRYLCERCNHGRLAWNARNGVTPYMVACPACDEGTMAHVDWHMDTRQRDRVPSVGDWVFLPMTPAVAALAGVRLDADAPMLVEVEAALRVERNAVRIDWAWKGGQAKGRAHV